MKKQQYYQEAFKILKRVQKLLTDAKIAHEKYVIENAANVSCVNGRFEIKK